MLLAKSRPRRGPPKELAEHGEDVMDAFEALFGPAEQRTRLAESWLRFFRLPPDRFAAFHANGLIACGLHDLGKATDSFQGAVEHRRPQAIRHEHMSALILMLPQVQAWLASYCDFDVVVSAVAGHHLKAAPGVQEKYPAFADPWQGLAEYVQLHRDHPNWRTALSNVAIRAGLTIPDFVLPAVWSFGGDVGQSIEQQAAALRVRFHHANKRLAEDRSRHALLMAVKAAVVVADSAGSGLPREGLDISAWLEPLFAEDNLLLGADIQTRVIEPRKAQIELRKRRTDPDYRFELQDFQDRAATIARRSLMLAPCGSGKTLAAWLWIREQLNAKSCTRVVFLYPTRATATEGFRDYVSHAPEADAALFTGTARYELQDLFENPEDGQAYLTDDRLYALGYWRKRVFSATVDQFLAFMQQVYRSLCLLPVLVDSIVVFDEVHSYDVGLFDTLKKFLDHFDLPVLCMTASLPDNRRRQLEALGLDTFTGAGLADLRVLAELPRYRVHRQNDRDSLEEIARQAVRRGRRVLWVVNTVDRCQALVQRLLDLEPLCYHSRFTLDDRKQRHARVISAFQGDADNGVIAITTQVCEMSLDLDAQVLISEFAPIAALIQRMGRCNRHATERDNSPGDVYLYSAESTLPYRPEEWLPVADFVAKITGQSVSQARLETLLERYTRHAGVEADRRAAFIDDGLWAQGGTEELRDGQNFSVQAVIDTDEYLRRSRLRLPVDGLLLPAPRSLTSVDSRLPHYLRCALIDHYDKNLGLLRRPIGKGEQAE